MFNSEQKSTRTSSLLVFVLIFTGTVQALETVPYAYGQKNYGSDLEDTDPEMMFAILASLGQTIVRANDMENTKRGLDLGLNRGYSGSQQAKHMMGIAAAGLSGGPGRRRRSQNTYRHGLPN